MGRHHSHFLPERTSSPPLVWLFWSTLSPSGYLPPAPLFPPERLLLAFAHPPVGVCLLTRAPRVLSLWQGVGCARWGEGWGGDGMGCKGGPHEKREREGGREGERKACLGGWGEGVSPPPKRDTQRPERFCFHPKETPRNRRGGIWN